MAAEQTVKKNISSLQVLKTLQVLLEGDYNMAELVEKLNSREKKPVFNSSVVSKYINTCRFCGIEVLKIQNRYFVASIPFGMELSVKEVFLLETLKNFAKANYSCRINKLVAGFVNRISSFSNRRILRVSPDTKSIVLKNFEQAIQEERCVCLLYKSGEMLEGIPTGINEHRGKTYFSIKSYGKERLICEDRISGLELLDKFYKPVYGEKVVVYKLKGGLAKRYQIRENEEIIGEKDGEFRTILNKGEKKDELLSRLLRYDNLCEIISPAEYRAEIQSIVNRALANYGE